MLETRAASALALAQEAQVVPQAQCQSLPLVRLNSPPLQEATAQMAA
jgi:hypothetical protein